MKKARPAKRSQSKRKRAAPSAKGTFVLGTERFALISSVEGLHLSRAMAERMHQFDREGLSAEERRKQIIGTHRKRG